MQLQIHTDGVFQTFEKSKQQYQENLKSSLSVKQQNDVFVKDKNQDKGQNKPLMAVLTLLGATLPILAINMAKGKGGVLVETFKNATSTGKDKFKAVYNMFEMKNYGDLLASTTGAVTAGVLGGILLDKNPENKKEKYKEGIFEFLNCMIPTTLVALGELVAEKTGKLKSAPAKAGMIIGSVAGGMFIANKTSNKINEKTFDKDEEIKQKRKFKISDCLVHMDDILGLLVLAKIPFAKTIHADKILPLLYAKSGYEVATASKESEEKIKNK